MVVSITHPVNVLGGAYVPGMPGPGMHSTAWYPGMPGAMIGHPKHNPAAFGQSRQKIYKYE